MPIYEYRCDNDHTFEVIQSMTEDSLDTCTVCGAPARRVLHAPAVHFKGSGFYTTDYARKGKKAGASDSSSSNSDSGGGDSKSSDSKGSESKSTSSGNGGGSKSESKSASGGGD
jgi:putative FmdB family regulatory protein